eukprot:6155673-Prorocentrum_lima.AAC.1
MNEPDTRDQDEGTIDMQWVEAFSELLEHVRLPSITPPDGELVLFATIRRSQVMILLDHQQQHCIIAPAQE